MENVVKIGEFKVTQTPDVLVTRALGSCVAVCIYSQKHKLGGLCHIVLPDSSMSNNKSYNPAKFADTGIKAVIDEIKGKMNTNKSIDDLEAKVIGGASMFSSLAENLNIGAKNSQAAEAILSNLNIPIVAKDTGEDYGRNVKFFLDTGVVEVTSFRKDPLIL